MFTAYPTHSPLRPLKLTRPILTGEDVFALQTMLVALDGAPGALDGILGPKTDAAILYVQADLGLIQDGVVGPATWTAGVGLVAEGFRQQSGLPVGLLLGQLAHESGLRGGTYSRPPRGDGSYDAGVAQRNTKYTLPKDGFDVPASIEALALNTAQHHKLFSGLDPKRRWTLAAGSWNAPATACWLARKEGATKVKASQTAKPGPAAAKAFDAYLAAVSRDLRV